jgi:putative holliday junction resolvase
MMQKEVGRLLAIDYGERRVGLAVTDPLRMIASPAGHIERRIGKRPPLTEIVRRAQEMEVTGIVIGLPLGADGEDTPRAIEVRAIATELERRTGWPVRLLDERFTTAAALRAVKVMGGSIRGRKGDVDALSATVLLQHALNVAE